MQKTYVYKVYENDGTTLLKTWEGNVVVSLPTFNAQMKGGYGNCSLRLKLPFDDFDEGTSIAYGNIVKIYEVDTDNVNGRIIYTGYISQYNPFFDNNKEGVNIELLGLVSLLTRDYYKNGATYAVTETSQDPSTIFQNIITQANSVLPGTPFSYSASTISTTGQSVTYTYTARKWVDALQDTFDLIGGGWFWYIGADGSVYLKQKPSSATHTFTIGKDIIAMSVVKSGEKLINEAYIDYNGGNTSDTDATSQTNYGKHAKYINDQSTTDATTAGNIVQTNVDDNKELKISASIVINDTYDIESIKPGDTCKIRNLPTSSSTFTDNMQIVRINYSPTRIELQLEEIVDFGNEFLRAIS